MKKYIYHLVGLSLPLRALRMSVHRGQLVYIELHETVLGCDRQACPFASDGRHSATRRHLAHGTICQFQSGTLRYHMLGITCRLVF